jgi:hypothetical protein
VEAIRERVQAERFRVLRRSASRGAQPALPAGRGGRDRCGRAGPRRVWERLEGAPDITLGTKYSQGREDTLGDLLDDAPAATASGALVAGWLRVSTDEPDSRLAMIQLDADGGA